MTPLDRLAAYIAGLHPKWREMPWEAMDEDTRELFREDARGAIEAYGALPTARAATPSGSSPFRS
jgi:hypothetical protein